MDKRKSYYRDYTSQYISGNAARKLQTAPDYDDNKRKEKVETQRRTYRNVDDAPRMGIKMVLFLAAAVTVSILLCINYLKVQMGITEAKSQIMELKSAVSVVFDQNNAMEYDIDSFIDVDYIIKVAKEELGMVVPNKGQIVPYQNSRSEYMSQYSDIPVK